MEAFYAKALPVDLLKSEQEQISDEIEKVEQELSRAETDVTKIEDTAGQMLDAVRNMEGATEQLTTSIAAFGIRHSLPASSSLPMKRSRVSCERRSNS